MNDLLTKKQRLYEELTQLAGYELLPYGKMIRARERVRQIKFDHKYLEEHQSLGCGKSCKIGFGFTCGIANAWGEEKLCPDCKQKLRTKWNEEDRKARLRK